MLGHGGCVVMSHSFQLAGDMHDTSDVYTYIRIYIYIYIYLGIESDWETVPFRSSRGGVTSVVAFPWSCSSLALVS